MRVTVVGLGYVGLVTAACLAEWGHRVRGLEVSGARAQLLLAGHLPFFEPGLAELVAPNVESGRLAFALADGDNSLASADIAIVAVGTHDGNGGWQTTTMQTCLSRVVPLLADGATLVIRSTLPPEFIRTLGTHVAQLRDEVGRGSISVMLNPEFTREGRAILDFTEPDRIVLGVVHDPDGSGEARLRELYASAAAPVIVVSAVDACLAKLGANLFLATKISFANELANLCEAFGADVANVTEALSYDRRIGGAFLRSGVGFGGSCLPHQVSMTVKTADAAGIDVPLMRAVEQINRRQRVSFVDRLRRLLGGSLAGRRVAVLGLAFKPQTDDLRDAPSLTIARLLTEEGAEVVAYDPMASARTLAAELVPGLVVVDSVGAAILGADAVGIVTEWSEFAELDWDAAGSTMRSRVMVDGRNALDPILMRALGFTYEGYGRPTAEAPDSAPISAPSAEAPAPAGVPLPA